MGTLPAIAYQNDPLKRILMRNIGSCNSSYVFTVQLPSSGFHGLRTPLSAVNAMSLLCYSKLHCVAYSQAFLFTSYRGSKYIELPYTVKGMDVSFSGILSYIEVMIGVLKFIVFIKFLALR